MLINTYLMKQWNIAPTGIIMLILLTAFTLSSCSEKPTGDQPPNIVILFADDMGYGDLSSYGNPTIRTPHIDGLGEQGIRFTSFVTASWCVPSRTELLTGRHMSRVEFGGGTGSDGEGGLPESEVTLAEGLQQAGYATGMAGKWHLGYKKAKFLPTNQGFDSWLGLPYSNDYRKPWVQTEEPLGMYRGTEMVDHPLNQDSLTVRYTQEATSFIEKNADGDAPFFFYLAYNMPHLPIHTIKEFQEQSKGGFYGDVIETIDWSVGRVLETLEEQGLSENTIVFFASDNGPWNSLPERMLQDGNEYWHTGSPGPLRGSKATTYEGGTRVPAMIRWPGQISSGQVTDALAAMPDIYRTLMETGGAELPDHPLDGYNLMPFLKGESDESPREHYAYIRGGQLQAYREGPWKLRLVDQKPQLFNLQNDPGERWNRADEKTGLVGELRQKMEEMAREVGVKMPGEEEEKGQDQS
ncbi:sulfatase family protein [Fodinibius sediminis]|uniref:Arylsulfatase A n=1 Tax=Fodinibius sediminis TaxID=1214077 RepID=A0A521DQ56_9BACT|nr:sulfatase [Fodinibius sediminis]SMO73695.1 Arylsulfatase A [Fodinibius sediminis]